MSESQHRRRMIRVKIRRTRSSNGQQRFRFPLCMAASICLHAIIVFAALVLPPLPGFGRQARELAVSQHLDDHKQPRRIIWLRKNDRLPEISPARGIPRNSPNQQRTDGLILRTDPPKPRHRDQYIRVDQPKTEDQKPVQSPNLVMTEAAPAASRPVRKSFVPPPERAQARPPSEAVVQEPQMNLSFAAQEANLPKPDLQLPKLPKPAARKYVPPADRARDATRTEQFALETTPLDAVGDGLAASGVPPGQGLAAPLGPVTAVVISATPSASTRYEQPEGNRAAKIESGSGPSGRSGSKEGDGGAGLVVPGVTLGGGKGQTGAVVAARAGGPSAPGAGTPSIPPAYRPRLDTPSVSLPLRPASRRVPQQVEALFQNRIVYCTVLPGPSGLPDWTVWFGESVPASSAQRSVMRPPITTKSQLAAGVRGLAQSERVWVTARLGKNGRISSVSIPPGVSPGLETDLATEMRSWQFTPAIKNGEAVDVDLLIEARFGR